jgi:hypothetical protein
MHVRILHHDRRWKRPDNHLDGRMCPVCHATVHGQQGQHGHLAWHAELINQLAGRPDAGPEDGPPVPWTRTEEEQAEYDSQEETG